MIGEERLQPEDRFPGITFERVRYVVMFYAQEKFYEIVAEPVQEQFMRRVVGKFRPFDETRAEDAVVSLFKLCVVRYDIPGVVRRVRHSNAYSVAFYPVEAVPHRQAVTGRAGIFDKIQGRYPGWEALKHLFGRVGAVVVDDQYLVIDTVLVQDLIDIRDRLLYRPLFIMRGYKDCQFHIFLT